MNQLKLKTVFPIRSRLNNAFLNRSFRGPAYEIAFRCGPYETTVVGGNDQKSRGSVEEAEKRIFPVRRERLNRLRSPSALGQVSDGRDGGAVKGRSTGCGHD